MTEVLELAAKVPTTEDVRHLLLRAEEAETRDEAVELIAEAVTAQLLRAMTDARITTSIREIAKPVQFVDGLRRAGLDRLLVEGWTRGRVTYAAAERHLERLRAALRDRTLAARDIKLGILAFDTAAQRLALTSGSRGLFSYPTRMNQARDTLLTFARALHR